MINKQRLEEAKRLFSKFLNEGLIKEEKNENYPINSNLNSGYILTILQSKSGNFSINLSKDFSCDIKSAEGSFNIIIPECSLEKKCDSEKSASMVINILDSLCESARTSPFLMPLGQNKTSKPLDFKNKPNPLCTFSSNKKFILSSINTKAFFSELRSKIQCGQNITFSQLRVCLEDVLEWMTHGGFISDVHYDDQSIVDSIKDALKADLKEDI